MAPAASPMQALARRHMGAPAHVVAAGGPQLTSFSAVTAGPDGYGRMPGDAHYGHSHGDDNEHAHAHQHSAKMYIVTYLVLAACTILTFTAAKHDFGELSFFIGMFIAVVKAMFVILFFMHLWDQSGPNRLTMGIAVFFVLVLISLTIADAATRFPLALPPGSYRTLHLGHNPFAGGHNPF